MDWTITKSVGLKGELRPPSDKSLTHRAYLFGAIAKGPCEIQNPLLSQDTEATLLALQAMGLQFERKKASVLLHPSPEWHSPQHAINCGNSGTTMRLLSGLIASRTISATLIGDHSLSKRPMNRVATPLRQMGAEIEGDFAPLTISGTNALRGIRYVSPVASAQVKSAILLAGLRADQETWVKEPALSRDHTERMLAALGVEILHGSDGVGLVPKPDLNAFQFSVPGDISSAAFWMVAATIVPHSDIALNEVGLNPSRTGICDVFHDAGANLVIESSDSELNEPVGNLHLRSGETLSAFSISGEMVPRLIDEIPVLAVLATQCEGVTTFRDAKELRVKESDRIEAVVKLLRNMGASVEEFEDGFNVHGPTPLSGTAVHADGDHRIAMAFSIAGLIAEGETRIYGGESVLTSYPDFLADLEVLQHG